MNSKEYLSEIQVQEERIEEQKMIIMSLKDSLTSIGISYEGERVQSSHDQDKMSKVFAKVDEEERKLARMQETVMNWKVSVVNKIEQMENPLHRKVLFLKYVEWKNHRTLKQVAEALGYSHEYVKELHGDALKIFPFQPS